VLERIWWHPSVFGLKLSEKCALELEEHINNILSGDNNVDVCMLLAILNKKLNTGKI
jgi:hypothetical protein